MDERRATQEDAGGAPWDRPSAALVSRGGVPSAVVCACPYLVAEDGWRAVAVSKEHRCAALDPPGSVGAERQRRVCLVSAHVDCATYRASEELRAVAVRLDADPNPDRPIVQTIPVILDSARAGGVRPFSVPRRGAQVALVGLMSVALAALIYARGIVPASERVPQATIPVTSALAVTSPSPSATAPSGTPATSPSPFATPTSTPAASPSPVATPTSTPLPSASPGTTPTSPPSTTYVVRPGDTLISIAARFGTTATQLRALNHITDPRALRVGQVLALP